MSGRTSMFTHCSQGLSWIKGQKTAVTLPLKRMHNTAIRSIEISVSVCLSVCFQSQKQHIQTRELHGDVDRGITADTAVTSRGWGRSSQ